MKTYVVLLCLLLAGCGLPLDKADFEYATQLCEANGGLKSLYYPFYGACVVRCNNGAVFKFDRRPEK